MYGDSVVCGFLHNIRVDKKSSNVLHWICEIDGPKSRTVIT